MVSKKLLFSGFMVLSVIALGTMLAYAQQGPVATVDFSDSEEVTIIGTISSVDDRGLTILSCEDSYHVVLPYSFNRNALDLSVGAEATLTGYIVDSLNYGPIFHATSINGITIDHASQQQLQARSKDGSGDCDGAGDGIGFMNKNGPNYGVKKA